MRLLDGKLAEPCPARFRQVCFSSVFLFQIASLHFVYRHLNFPVPVLCSCFAAQGSVELASIYIGLDISKTDNVMFSALDIDRSSGTHSSVRCL